MVNLMLAHSANLIKLTFVVASHEIFLVRMLCVLYTPLACSVRGNCHSAFLLVTPLVIECDDIAQLSFAFPGRNSSSKHISNIVRHIYMLSFTSAIHSRSTCAVN